MAYRQCPKRLWLEVHRPDLRQDSTATQSSFQMGYAVGQLARSIYDPTGSGSLIDAQKQGLDAALQHTQKLLAGRRPIFEAGFSAGSAVALADVLLPVTSASANAWRMIEVKSSSKVKQARHGFGG